MIHSINLNATVDAVYDNQTLILDGVNRASQVLHYHGGKGANVARVISRLGGKGRLLAFSGAEDYRQAKKFFSAEKVRTDLVAVPGKARVCLILMDRKKKQETVVNAPTSIFPKKTHLLQIQKKLIAGIRVGDLVTLSGSAPEGLDKSCFAQLIAAAQKADARALQDSYGPGLVAGMKAAPWLIKINEDELRSSFGWSAVGEKGLLQSMRRLQKRGSAIVIVTRGAKATLVRAGSSAWRLYPLKPKPGLISAVGCGDAFLAGLALGIDQEESFSDSLALAAAASWDNLNRPGSCFIQAKEIFNAAKRVTLQGLKKP